jgi:hypothetical protein
MKIVIMCLIVALSCSCHRPVAGLSSGRRYRELSRIMNEYLRGVDSHHAKQDAGFEFRGPLTVDQAEMELIERYRANVDLVSQNTPAGPYHFASPHWGKLKSKYKDGDEFYAFFVTWQATLHQTQGYVLIRQKEVLGTIVTWLN